MIREYKGALPRIHADAVILDQVVITGDVEIGADSSVWFGAVIRGDVGAVRIGRRTNIQDLCVLHETLSRTSCIIGDEVTVGHRAVIHGAVLKNRCLVGMGAIVMDEAIVGENCIVGAASLVPEGMVIPDGHLALGVPARVIRPLSDVEIESLAISAEHYVQYAKEYSTGS
ncbi:MAG: gamma carbonic anhydrase family protein [Deltaproteobacteria bacterium]|nr:gamma carbonic anhydrase family protein [Deltaproteobacteria bacterium]